MEKLKNYDRTELTSYKKYKVYERTMWGPEFLGETTAKSKAQAVNSVRYRNYGTKRYNDDFFAVEENPDLSHYHWYVVEYCVQDGYDPYFAQSIASYSVEFERSEREAKEAVRNQYYFYGDGGDGSYRNAYFGRIQKFDSESDARKCAEEWDLVNKEDIEKNTSEEARQWLKNFADSISDKL